MLDVHSPSNGHVPRNTRLGLLAIDIVQPYTCIVGLSMEQKVVDNKVTYQMDVKWTAGGGMKVDATWLSLHRVGKDMPLELYTSSLESLEQSDISLSESNYQSPLKLSQISLISNFTSAPPSSLRGQKKKLLHRFLEQPKVEFLQASQVQKGFARWGTGNQGSYSPTIFGSSIVFTTQIGENSARISETRFSNSTGTVFKSLFIPILFLPVFIVRSSQKSLSSHIDTS